MSFLLRFRLHIGRNLSVHALDIDERGTLFPFSFDIFLEILESI